VGKCVLVCMGRWLVGGWWCVEMEGLCVCLVCSGCECVEVCGGLWKYVDRHRGMWGECECVGKRVGCVKGWGGRMERGDVHR